MLRERTQTDTAALIARYIEPYPGIPDLGEYRLKEEFNGYPLYSIIGNLAPDGSNAVAVAHGYAVPLEAVEAAQAFYALHSAAIDDRLAANRVHLP